MSVTWCAIDPRRDEIIRYVADRNNPEAGTVVAVCSLSMRTAHQVANAVLDAFDKQTKSTFAPSRARSWALAEVWARTWKVRHIVLLGVHRLGPGLIEESAAFASRVGAEITMVASGRLRSTGTKTLRCLGNEISELELLQCLEHPPNLHGSNPLPRQLTPRELECFETARRAAFDLLPGVDVDEGWFVDIERDRQQQLSSLVKDLVGIEQALHASACRGVLAGTALSGWRLPVDGGRFDDFIRRTGAEPWGALDRYREPSSACAVALCALGLTAVEVDALIDSDVSSEGALVSIGDSAVEVVSPCVRRCLVAQRLVNDGVGGPRAKFLRAHGQPLTLATIVDTVRRSVGVLGTDLVT